MNTRFHGVTSITLIGLATALAAVAMFQASLALGMGYLIACGVVMGAVLYAFCAKCPCRAKCGHVVPGRIAALFGREPGPYTPVEYGVLAIFGLVLIGAPQFWLWRTPWLLVGYWALAGVGVVQILTFVCRACTNVYCPVKIARQR
ncbi:MAG: hypothetical protein GVY30_07610 [Chloroflexi bacterium]|jgi:hypothetical protein|nr:hypothetical protein [Chloroflexota bacterium]